MITGVNPPRKEQTASRPALPASQQLKTRNNRRRSARSARAPAGKVNKKKGSVPADDIIDSQRVGASREFIAQVAAISCADTQQLDSGTPMGLRFRTLSLGQCGTQNQTQLGKPKALLYRTALFPQFLNRNHDLLPQIEEVAGIRLGRLLFCLTATAEPQSAYLVAALGIDIDRYQQLLPACYQRDFANISQAAFERVGPEPEANREKRPSRWGWCPSRSSVHRAEPFVPLRAEPLPCWAGNRTSGEFCGSKPVPDYPTE